MKTLLVLLLALPASAQITAEDDSVKAVEGKAAVAAGACAAAAGKKTAKVLDDSCEADGNGVTHPCEVYSPIRSNLCEAQKAAGGVAVDYALFGKNDCRAGKKDRLLSSITKVVIHNGGWDAKHNADTWACRAAASHYSIQRGGEVFQHMGEELVGAHTIGLNSEAIGIELNLPKENGTSCNSLKFKKKATKEEKEAIVRKACTPTEAQYTALKALITAIAARTAVTFDEDHVVGHCESSKGENAHGDPRSFDWSKLGLSNEKKKKQAEGTACAWYNLY